MQWEVYGSCRDVESQIRILMLLDLDSEFPKTCIFSFTGFFAITEQLFYQYVYTWASQQRKAMFVLERYIEPITTQYPTRRDIYVYHIRSTILGILYFRNSWFFTGRTILSICYTWRYSLHCPLAVNRLQHATTCVVTMAPRYSSDSLREAECFRPTRVVPPAFGF